jgi:hypothetical protein
MLSLDLEIPCIAMVQGKDVASILEANGVVSFSDPYTQGFGWDPDGEGLGLRRRGTVGIRGRSASGVGEDVKGRCTGKGAQSLAGGPLRGYIGLPTAASSSSLARWPTSLARYAFLALVSMAVSRVTGSLRYPFKPEAAAGAAAAEAEAEAPEPPVKLSGARAKTWFAGGAATTSIWAIDPGSLRPARGSPARAVFGRVALLRSLGIVPLGRGCGRPARAVHSG